MLTWLQNPNPGSKNKLKLSDISSMIRNSKNHDFLLDIIPPNDQLQEDYSKKSKEKKIVFHQIIPGTKIKKQAIKIKNLTPNQNKKLNTMLKKIHEEELNRVEN